MNDDRDRLRLLQLELSLQKAFTSMNLEKAVTRDVYLQFQRASDDARLLLKDVSVENTPWCDQLKKIHEKLEAALLIDATGAWMVEGKLIEASISSLSVLFPKPEAFLDAVQECNALTNALFKADVDPSTDNLDDLEELLKELQGYVGSDHPAAGNYSILPVRDDQLQMVRSSLKFTIQARKLPAWSATVIEQINGCVAVLEALRPLILPTAKRLTKLWNKALSSLKVNISEWDDQEADAQTELGQPSNKGADE